MECRDLALLMVLGCFGTSATHCSNRSRGGQVAKIPFVVAEHVADQAREARQGPPRVFLDQNAATNCDVFGRYLSQCPRVPSCEAVLKSHEQPTLNACTNERGALARVTSCGDARTQDDSRCTLSSFLPCTRLEAATCNFEVVVCDRGFQELAVLQCCTDPSAQGCERGRYFALAPRR